MSTFCDVWGQVRGGGLFSGLDIMAWRDPDVLGAYPKALAPVLVPIQRIKLGGEGGYFHFDLISLSAGSDEII